MICGRPRSRGQPRAEGEEQEEIAWAGAGPAPGTSNLVPWMRSRTKAWGGLADESIKREGLFRAPPCHPLLMKEPLTVILWH